MKMEVKQTTYVLRLKRALQKRDERLVYAKRLGRYLRVNAEKVLDHDVDLIALGKELGELENWEAVEGLSQKGKR